MLAIVQSATVDGIEGHPVRVEVHVSAGLPGFTVVGQPDAPCRESRDRVRAALLSSGFEWTLRRVTVNLAPSSVRKVGAGFDLPMAVGLLIANGAIPPDAVADCAFIGELGLDGSLRRVPGIVSMVGRLRDRAVLVPASAGAEAALAGGRVRTARSLRQLVAMLRGEEPWPAAPVPGPSPEEVGVPDMAEVKGQPLGRWAVKVAAAGGHHLLMVGPPGAGKTMLAERLPGLLPALGDAEALETTRVWSVAGVLPEGCGLIRRPPFRAPHHSTPTAALVGGGTTRLRPGEVSLAHHGVLFMDEMSEFPRAVLDSLRQPLEQGTITVCRASTVARFPARFQLVGATNPCPCGYSAPGRECRCSAPARVRYAQKLSGPLLDRFDLRIVMPRSDISELMDVAPAEPTAVMAAEVARVRELSRRRGFSDNAAIPAAALDELAPLAPAARRLVRSRLEAGSLNPRGLHRTRRVALTLADLDGHDGPLGDEHMAAALALRTEEQLLRAA
jgi:magnesium chelatase family protein